MLLLTCLKKRVLRAPVPAVKAFRYGFERYKAFMDLALNSTAIPDEPFAIAYSGGGDSTALLYALRKKNPFVFIVDHGLRLGSAPEAVAAKRFAAGLGLRAQILTWSPGAIQSGLQAKARRARYRLLGQACRAAGLRCLLTGHTEDDQAETVLMRLRAGGNWRGGAAMAALTPSPLWPELAEIEICRPMLGASRADIRQYLEAHKLNFMDDPSNENRGFARIRARDELAAKPWLRRDMLHLSRDMQAARSQEATRLKHEFKRCVSADEFGNIYLTTLPSRQLISRLICAVSGTDEKPRDEALLRLRRAMEVPKFKSASLGGAIFSADKKGWLISRDSVVAQGRDGVAALAKAPFAGRILWDGRFWIEGGGEVSPTGEQWIDAPKPLKAAIMLCPARARSSLPHWTRGDEIVAIGPYDVNGGLHKQVKSAVSSRLEREFTGRNPQTRLTRTNVCKI